MTDSEKEICKIYLEGLDQNHTCNKYKLLMELKQTRGNLTSRDEVLRIIDRFEYNVTAGVLYQAVCGLQQKR